MKKYLLLSLAVLAWSAPLMAQENIDDLFGADSGAGVTEAPKSATQADELLLKNDGGVKWGGDFTPSLGWNGGWSQVPDTSDLSKYWADAIGITVNANLYFDARPDKDFRVYGKFSTAYPLATTYSIDGLQDPTKAYQPNPFLANYNDKKNTTFTLTNIKIWELFSDFNLGGKAFFRLGKQVASWGVSRFYSPGDVVSLSAKNAEDPTADREGPFALKMNVPLPGATLWGYVLAKDTYFTPGVLPTYRNLGYGLKGDFVVGNAELSLGGYYQKDLAPKGVASISTSIGDVSVFSEGTISWGSDRNWISGQATGGLTPVLQAANLTMGKDKDHIYYQATAGGFYQNSDLDLTIYAEYYYNGLGSSDPDYLANSYLAYAANQMDSTKFSGISLSDLMNPNLHNFSATVSFSKIADSDFGTSLLWQGNLIDNSGWFVSTVSWAPNDWIDLSTGLKTGYGPANSEFMLTLAQRSGTWQGPKNGPAPTAIFFLNAKLGFGKF